MAAASAEIQERRRFPRFPALLSASLQHGPTRSAAVCTNIGPGGCFLAVPNPPAPGTRIEATFAAGDEKGSSIHVMGEVVRRVEKNGEHQPGCGVRWLTARCEAGVEVLSRWLREAAHISNLGPMGVGLNNAAHYYLDRSEDKAATTAIRADSEPVAAEQTRLASLTAEAIAPLLVNRYSEIQFLAAGGNGVVFRAHDLRLCRPVVLKFMASGLRGVAWRYFEREMKIVASLNHPNIVRIYDSDRLFDVPYYVMEYVDGHPLSEDVEAGLALDPAVVLRVAEQLASALDYTHERGVLHRDVKPANVVLTADGVAKLLDFGLARRADQRNRGSLIVGTPYYMAPEQFAGSKLGPRTDIYALGVMLYEMLTGSLPFSDDDVLQAHLFSPVPDPLLINPGLPHGVRPVLLRLLSKAPSARYPDCATAVTELRAALRPQPKPWDPSATQPCPHLPADAPATPLYSAATPVQMRAQGSAA